MPDALEHRLIALFQHPKIQGCNWQPRLFWHAAADGSPFGRLRVDGGELEVFLATIVGEASTEQARLDREQDGRGRFIAANARRHELPLFTRI
ncbi:MULTISPECIES: hypothetical protein [unclassified Thioalkalivibrio]|uniref:hypothetical protein n=1 Tax=unclassified Thioalkalivibrio TaxID=2621013 RepID=UPI00035E5F3F|nr:MULTISPECIES: hypothetical protein [unclassified Thioalkalivibrio]